MQRPQHAVQILALGQCAAVTGQEDHQLGVLAQETGSQLGTHPRPIIAAPDIQSQFVRSPGGPGQGAGEQT